MTPKVFRWTVFGLALAALSAGCEGLPSPGMQLGGESQYTILLMNFSGPEHVELADFHLKQAKKFTGWSDLYVVHQESHSELYRGHYRTMQEASNDLRSSKQYVAPAAKQNIYRMATIVPLPGKDIGPPEWNLRNAQGEYTVLVAVFQDLPEQNYYGRKDKAVDLCRKLREQGREAYFLHDTSRSGVTIGTFPAKAIQTKRVKRIHPKTGDAFFEDVKLMVDPKMKAVMQDYPEFLFCGNTVIRTTVDEKTGKAVKKADGPEPLSISQFKKGLTEDNAFHRAGNP
jgi:hypothetical protein